MRHCSTSFESLGKRHLSALTHLYRYTPGAGGDTLSNSYLYFTRTGAGASVRTVSVFSGAALATAVSVVSPCVIKRDTHAIPYFVNQSILPCCAYDRANSCTSSIGMINRRYNSVAPVHSTPTRSRNRYIGSIFSPSPRAKAIPISNLFHRGRI